MLVINDSGFKFGCLLGRVPPRALSGTFLVKATLALKHGAAAEILPEDAQTDLDGDQPWSEDPAEGLRYGSDFALFKPGADLLLQGTAFAPGGKPAEFVDVSFAVGTWSKSLIVFGDRIWKSGFLSSEISPPTPFIRMPITWSRAFGGRKFKRNPVGRGLDESRLADGSRVRWAPNVESPGSLLRSSDSRSEPSGFGPVDASWPPRMEKTGTYGKDWLRNHWPWFPEDFDWTYFNSAPEDQQWRGSYLSGDERVLFRNLHPAHPSFESRLPAVRPRWFIHLRKGNALEFLEVPLVLDTLWADPEHERAVLVWRGVTDVLTWKMKEVEEYFLLREPLHAPKFRTLEAYRQHFLARKEEILREAEVEPVMLEPKAIPAPVVPDLDWVEGFEKEIEHLRARGGPFDPARLPGWSSSPAASRPLAPVPPVIPGPQNLTEAAAMMRRDWEVVRAADPGFAKGMDAPPDLSHLIQTEKEMDEAFKTGPARPASGETEDVVWTRERVQAHAAEGKHFEDQNLEGLDLSGLDLRGRRFRGAILRGADLTGGKLDGCDFTGASLGATKLESASLRDCLFVEADLAEAAGPEAQFAGSTLDHADFSDAKLPRSSFARTRGVLPILAGCDLTGSDFENCDLRQPDFTEALLSGSKFRNASLPDAGFYEVQGPKCDFTGARLLRARCSQSDFTDGLFARLQGSESIWDDCTLVKADFREANLRIAIFTGARLDHASFHRADLAEAKLDDCHAHGTQFAQANLFRGTFEGADLTGAVLIGSNLYEVEFFRTMLHGTDLREANLTRTKLA